MPHHVMPVKGFLSPEPPAHQLYMPTPSAPAPKSTRSIAPRRLLLNSSPLPVFGYGLPSSLTCWSLLMVATRWWERPKPGSPLLGCPPLVCSFLSPHYSSLLPTSPLGGRLYDSCLRFAITHAGVLVTKKTTNTTTTTTSPFYISVEYLKGQQ